MTLKRNFGESEEQNQVKYKKKLGRYLFYKSLMNFSQIETLKFKTYLTQ